MKQSFTIKSIFFLITSISISCNAYTLTKPEARAIGAKIWKNECNGSINGLTTWRKGEDFASLGIGHFIWYPSNKQQPFKETFPQLLRFIKARNGTIPHSIWHMSQHGCPWKNREEFHKQFYSKKMIQLRNFLHKTIDYQTQFMIKRLEDALPKIANSTKNKKQVAHIKQQFTRMIQTKHGWYPLIDYLNFKGEGLKDHKHYNNINWGLKQVLLEMKGKSRGAHALQEFNRSAKQILQQRVANAPKKQKALEQQWLKGWFNRIDTYIVS